MEERTGYGQVAGLRVIRYTSTYEDHDVAFAPAFGCEVMEESKATYNDYGLPTSGYYMIVTKYIPGEPDPRLLQVPPNYRIIDNPY